MKQLITILAITLIIISCGTSKKTNTSNSTDNLEEAVVIGNDSLEYQITIYDPGFGIYLRTVAKPESFYSQSFLENKNIFYVSQWNYRAQNPLQYGDFYASIIDYDQNVNYGLEVNYKLYNYFQYIRREYGIRL